MGLTPFAPLAFALMSRAIVHYLAIRPVDFKPKKFADCTAINLQRLLDETGQPGSTPVGSC
jgi:hypothetical protein